MISQLPNPVTIPSWQQLFLWIIEPLKLQDQCQAKYGDCFTLNLGKIGTFVIVANPQAIQEIFAKDNKSFDSGKGNRIIAPLLGENSLILMDGEQHKQERKLLMPPFHGERLQTYAQQICEITEQITAKLSKGQKFIARTLTQEITLEVIIQVIFGLREGKRYQQLKPLLTKMINVADSPWRSSIFFFNFLQQDWGNWSPWGKMQRRRQKIYELLQAEIEQRRNYATNQGTDILSLMMSLQDEEGNSISDQQLKDELMTLLLAGHETTATILAWALYQIHRHPQILAKLKTELNELGNNPEPMAIAKLPYLKAVCQETLRMYPVIPLTFPRITKTNLEIGGHKFEPETVLMPSIYLVHYREDLYPEPHKFKPERFFERQYSPSEYFPFGGSSRRCLGYALAELEMKLVLATILSNYQLKLTDNKVVKMQRRGLTLAPRGGVGLTVVTKMTRSK